MANTFKEFFYPTTLDRNRELLPSGVDEGIRRIYDQYYSEYHAGLVIYKNDRGDLTIAPVTVAGIDSGGAGFRALRVPNGN